MPAMNIYLSVEIEDWLRKQPEGISQTIARLCETEMKTNFSLSNIQDALEDNQKEINYKKAIKIFYSLDKETKKQIQEEIQLENIFVVRHKDGKKLYARLKERGLIKEENVDNEKRG